MMKMLKTFKAKSPSKIGLKNDFHAVPRFMVVKLMRKESEEWLPVLSKDEESAIKDYTNTGVDLYKKLNKALRGEEAMDEQLEKYSESISCAIKKYQLRHNIIVYRGTGKDTTDGAAVGETRRFHQFTSCSVVKSGAHKEDYMLKIHVPKGACAAYIEKLSHQPKERELLIDKNCAYRVLSRKGNVVEIELIRDQSQY